MILRRIDGWSKHLTEHYSANLAAALLSSNVVSATPREPQRCESRSRSGSLKRVAVFCQVPSVSSGLDTDASGVTNER